jgi:hypothetical protein
MEQYTANTRVGLTENGWLDQIARALRTANRSRDQGQATLIAGKAKRMVSAMVIGEKINPMRRRSRPRAVSSDEMQLRLGLDESPIRK